MPEIPHPTWLECWPPALHDCSFPHRARPCSLSEAHALGRRNGIRIHRFSPDHDASLDALGPALDTELQTLPPGAFVRLGSRSPKDTALALLQRGRAWSGADAVRLLTAGSLRMAVDLDHCVRAGYRPWIYLRAWQALPWHGEFRAFVQGGRVTGISQYFHDSPLPEARCPDESGRLAHRLHDGLRRLLPWLPLPDVVVDIALDATAPTGVRLIELNPWGEMSDPCLFRWRPPDFDATLRLRTASGIEHIPIP